MRIIKTTAIAGAAIFCGLWPTVAELPARTTVGTAPMAYERRSENRAVAPPAAAERRPKAAALRTVTAYNVGDPRQTWGDPCIDASGDDICAALDAGMRRCAANFVPFGTRLHIDRWGNCTVTDRMHRRFGNRVDIAMKRDEHRKALTWGKQELRVAVLALGGG